MLLITRLVAVASIMIVTGCSTAAPGPSDLLGVTLGDANDILPETATYLVQDLSVAVALEPEYDATQFDSTGWTIVDACSDEPTLAASSTIELAVVPTDALDDLDSAEASGALACEGLSR